MKAKKYENMSVIEKVFYLMCKDHSAKMEGLWSISTSVLENPHCQAMRKVTGAICQSCYAHNMAEYRETLREKLKKATELLTTRILAWYEIPLILVSLFRFEAFGDLINEVQVVNYFNIAKKNENVKCALWTKYPQVIKKAMETYGIEKPKNIVIIVSSPFVNVRLNIEKVQKVFPFVDKVFTVWDKETIKEKGIDINCGGRKCALCRTCYDAENGIKYIDEKKK